MKKIFAPFLASFISLLGAATTALAALPTNPVITSNQIALSSSFILSDENDFDFSTTGSVGSAYSISFTASSVPQYTEAFGAAITSMTFNNGTLTVGVQLLNEIGFSSPGFQISFFDFGIPAGTSAKISNALHGIAVSYSTPSARITEFPFKAFPAIKASFDVSGVNNFYQVWFLIPKTAMPALKSLAHSKERKAVVTLNGRKPKGPDQGVKVISTPTQTLYRVTLKGTATPSTVTLLAGMPDAFFMSATPTNFFPGTPVTITLSSVSCPRGTFTLLEKERSGFKRIFAKKPKNCSVSTTLRLLETTTFKGEFLSHAILLMLSQI